MIKCIDLPNKTFSTKEEMFTALKEQKETIINLKKAKSVVKYAPILSFNTNTNKSISVKENHILAVINTTNYLDSHNDVHLKGIWTKSVSEQQNKIYYITNHDFNIGSVIAYPKDVNVKVEQVSWSDLGYNFTGTTDALIYEVDKDKIEHKEALKIIKENIDIQHSVSMQYVKLELCIDSTEEEFKEEKMNFDKYIGEVVNAEKVEDYFWAVQEAKIYREGSMVLGGSNDLTPLIQGKSEPLKDTQLNKNEPSADTQKRSKIYNLI
jgi:hypothetical protein